MPATSKVLAIIDKGVRDRVTKNGETLRRHAESAQRWKNLRERIARTDAEMETVRHILTHGDTGSDHGSAGTASTQNGYLATPRVVRAILELPAPRVPYLDRYLPSESLLEKSRVMGNLRYYL